MSYPVPTLDELHTFLVAFWKFAFPLSNVGSRFSYHWKRLRAYAGAVTDLHAHIESAIRDVMPDTSTGAFLTRWGNILQVIRKGATGARGTNALQVFGVIGSTVNALDQLQDPTTGFTYQVTATKVIPAAGFVLTDVAAISTGAATRLSVGTNLNFIAASPGIGTVAKIVVALTTDGFDSEQDPAYSVRVNDEFGKARMGGHEDDFVKWMLEITGISSAYCYPNRAGIGTIDLVGFHAGQGSARSLTVPEIAAALTYVKSKVPAQLGAQYSALRVLTTTAVPTSIEVQILTNGDQAFATDWDDGAGASAPVVSVYTPATRTVQFTATVPSSLLAAMRVVFKGVGSVQDGRVFTVDTISTTTNPNDTITIRETVPTNLAATDIMYAAGPLTQVIRDAIVAHLNGEIVYADRGQPLGASAAVAKGLTLSRLNVLADALGPANPAGAYGTWTGDVAIANINRIATYATGVRNVTNVSPTVDVAIADNAFPSDASTNFATPNQIIVRRG